jgi:hypothetical protein
MVDHPACRAAVMTPRAGRAPVRLQRFQSAFNLQRSYYLMYVVLSTAARLDWRGFAGVPENLRGAFGNFSS